MDIKERIKRARKLAALSQSELAKKLGLSLMTIRRWESGEISPRINEIQKLSSVLDVSVEYLIGTRNDMLPQTKNQIDEALGLTETLKNEDTDLQEPITTGLAGNMIVIKDWNTKRTFCFPNDQEGRKVVAALMNCAIGTNAHNSPQINNGTNSNYHNSTVNNGSPVTVTA